MSSQPPNWPNSRSQNYNARKEGVWGKKKVIEHVPKVFIEGCRKTTESGRIKEDLLAEGLGIVEVTQASHQAARARSFIVTVKTREDFVKLLSGELIPENVRVRQYYPPRNPPPPPRRQESSDSNVQSTSSVSRVQSQQVERGIKELDEMSKDIVASAGEQQQIQSSIEQHQRDTALSAAGDLLTASQMSSTEAV